MKSDYQRNFFIWLDRETQISNNHTFKNGLVILTGCFVLTSGHRMILRRWLPGVKRTRSGSQISYLRKHYENSTTGFIWKWPMATARHLTSNGIFEGDYETTKDLATQFLELSEYEGQDKVITSYAMKALIEQQPKVVPVMSKLPQLTSTQAVLRLVNSLPFPGPESRGKLCMLKL